MLVLDRIGKNIAGTGFDCNVVGRYSNPDLTGGPAITRIAALSLTPETHGNANGIGLVDVTTRRVFERMTFDETYPNALTSTASVSVKIPMVLATDALAIQRGDPDHRRHRSGGAALGAHPRHPVARRAAGQPGRRRGPERGAGGDRGRRSARSPSPSTTRVTFWPERSGRSRIQCRLRQNSGEAGEHLVHDRLRHRFETPPVAGSQIEGARLVTTDHANGSGACIVK